MAPDSGTPGDPPLPRVESILPLGYGHQWAFSYSDYDVNGVQTNSRLELNLYIGQQYGYVSDTSGHQIIELDPYSENSTYSMYVYQYEWEDKNSGWLISYRDLDVSVKGVYIMGEFEGPAYTLYDTAKLWLAYPAAAGTQWSLVLGDSANQEVYSMKVDSVNARYYAPGSSGACPIKEYSCYRYSQTLGDTVSYQYFNSDVGQVAYLQYIGGVLRRTHILKWFSPYYRYYYM
jgi:hypothetical protein